MSPGSHARVKAVSAFTTSTSTWRQTNRRPALGSRAPGLLPGALLPNAGLRFVCRQVDVEVVNADTAFTRACEPGDILSIPVKHTTGRYYAPEEDLRDLDAHGQIILRYREGHNPNGSVADIAGVSNRERNVMGLMPHPEHAVDPVTGSADGGRLFESMATALAPA